MRPIQPLTLITVTAINLALLTGCETSQPQTPQTTQVSCKLPNITPLAETKPSQEKGGLEITVVPANYRAVRTQRLTITPTEPNFGEAVLAPPTDQRAQMTFVQETSIPQLNPQPDRLQFAVRINNKLSRVFRGQGAVVQLNVAGKLMPIHRDDYAEFVDCIVPPRNEAELKIFGPRLESVPDKGTLGVFLYDVVTATDTAGNVTEKQNYEWYFSYETQLAQDSGPTTTRRGWANNSTLGRFRMQSQQGGAAGSVIENGSGPTR